MTKVIEIKNVTKKYKLYNTSKERFLDFISPKSYGTDFLALNDVNFKVNKGDSIGFVGINGAGKSTLSNIIAGIIPITNGNITVNGQTTLISIADGLNNDLSGRDNIELKCLMLGFSKSEIRKLEPCIIELSELENFIDQPVKSYSSGMKSRLGFAISVHINPDIMIIDEALSVGDKAFAAKCLKHMQEFKKQGKTIIFISHSTQQIKEFCNKILWLEYEQVKAYGEISEILPLYEGFLKKWQTMSKIERTVYRLMMTNKKTARLEYSPQSNRGLLNDNSNLFEKSQSYEISPISKLVHLKSFATYIYSVPNNDSDKLKAAQYKNRVYHVKRKAIYHFEEYYLLSTKASGTEGVIGWIKAKETTSHPYTIVDFDKKNFILKGTGVARLEPWGSKYQFSHHSLEHLAGLTFSVSETVLIGKNV